MFDAFITGLILIFEWPAIGFLMLGVVIGMWLGAIPGLGGFIGLVLLLPFTYGMDPVPAFALLLGMFAVTTTSDTIASVLLGVPGTAASQATILDGYPLASGSVAHRKEPPIDGTQSKLKRFTEKPKSSASMRLIGSHMR